MIKVDHVRTFNFDGAIRGMRNPYDSWDKSDSTWMEVSPHSYEMEFRIGEKDMELMRKLFKAGTEHRKFMRQIFICMDITAPFYWWKQFDKYQIGVTTNSCSTMHTITKYEFNEDNFSNDCMMHGFRQIIRILNGYREQYLAESDLDKKKKIWRGIVQLLPESYNQKRTVTMNYEVAANIIHQRKNHKLKEWNEFIDILLRDLPYLQEIIEG